MVEYGSEQQYTFNDRMSRNNDSRTHSSSDSNHKNKEEGGKNNCSDDRSKHEPRNTAITISLRTTSEIAVLAQQELHLR